jgi:hypothetical protein
VFKQKDSWDGLSWGSPWSVCPALKKTHHELNSFTFQENFPCEILVLHSMRNHDKIRRLYIVLLYTKSKIGYKINRIKST